MQLVSDPSIATKINQMKRRVCWQHSSLQKRSIDQTSLVINDGKADNPEFSFLVIGDSGCGEHLGHHPQRQIAEMMLEQREQINFVLHTGDVIYQVGSSEYYYKNFIRPYREFLVGGESPQQITYDRMVFNLPFLPVPGNHDYYDLPLIYGILSQLTWPLRRLLRSHIDLNVGWHGSHQGQAYAEAFLDYLLHFHNPKELEHHLDSHYTATINDNLCLHYQPTKFTRLPNRYYTFRYGNIDFFALDSNTFNQPPPLPHTEEGEAIRRQLLSRREKLEREKQQIFDKSNKLDPENPEQAELLDDYRGKLSQIEEQERDIAKRLRQQPIVTDTEQLNWLTNKLIESWHNSQVRGRVLYFHHPPYVTETTKWNQGQTLEIRRRLRQVLDEVAENISEIANQRPPIDIVLSGHAHCLEHLYTENTGHADSYINWLVCGGSGHSLRRQKRKGSVLTETLNNGGNRQVAQSLMFVGRNGRGSRKKRPYSFLRIDVTAGTPPKFIIRPFVAERYQHHWHNYQLESFAL